MFDPQKETNFFFRSPTNYGTVRVWVKTNNETILKEMREHSIWQGPDKRMVSKPGLHGYPIYGYEIGEKEISACVIMLCLHGCKWLHGTEENAKVCETYQNPT